VAPAKPAAHGPRALVLEDDRSRIAEFHRLLPGHTLDVTADPQQAIAWLGTHRYDTIFIDHDLTAEHYEGEGELAASGYAVAAWLSRHPQRQRGATIVIHSLNTAGSERMVNLLFVAGLRVVRIPFPEWRDRIQAS